MAVGGASGADDPTRRWLNDMAGPEGKWFRPVSFVLTSEGFMFNFILKKRNWPAWVAALLLGSMAGQAQQAKADDIGVADPILPLPLYHPRADKGGLFVSTSFVMYQQTNPLSHQGVAYRGFVDVDGTAQNRIAINPLTGNLVPITSPTQFAGSFVGSNQEALNVNSVSGPASFQPGMKIDAGWKFNDGTSLTVNGLWLAQVSYTSAATLAPRGLQVGGNYADSFLYAPVYNFLPDYSGPFFDVINSSPTLNNLTLQDRRNQAGGTAYGIWNAAEVMTQEFTQRLQTYNIDVRVPVYENETYRLSGIVGARMFWIWERYKWRTIDYNIDGQAGGLDQAIYTNIVSNRMYGAHLACQNEWYLGHGFAFNFIADAGLMIDIVKTRAKYELGEKYIGPVSKRGRSMYTLVPELAGTFGISWYPVEGIEMKVGYDVMALFNTISSRHPIDFNFGAMDPAYESQFRLINGFTAGIALVF